MNLLDCSHQHFQGKLIETSCSSKFWKYKVFQEDSPIEQKLLESTKNLFENTLNLSQKDIDAVLVSTNDNSKYLAAILSELSGISPKISHTVESLCNSGTNTIVSGISYIASGLADIALIVGGDRFDSPGQILEWDKSRGEFKHPIFWASIFTKSYKREFGATDEELAAVSAKNHHNAKDNPFAYSDKQFSIEDVLNSRQITGDLRLFDCSRPCTGSSAILLASESVARKYTDSPVWITGIGQKTTSAGFTKNQDFTKMDSTIEAGKNALSMADKKVGDIDVIELHDAFSVCEPLALEDLGIIEKGQGAKFSKELFETENNFVNPRGGLIGSGHPLGATGLAQTNEIVSQLQGKSKKRQVSNAKTGLVHNMSAAATSSTVLVLES